MVTVTPRTLPKRYKFVGEVESSRRVEVRTRVEGVIEQRPFTEGALVRAGQVLYRLDQVRAWRSAKARDEKALRLADRLDPLLAQHAVAQQDAD